MDGTIQPMLDEDIRASLLDREFIPGTVNNDGILKLAPQDGSNR